jgi:hypothetical protein
LKKKRIARAGTGDSFFGYDGWISMFQGGERLKFGHQAGDQLLRELSVLLFSHIRSSDFRVFVMPVMSLSR